MSRKAKLLIFFIILVVIIITILTYIYLYLFIIPADIDISKLEKNKHNVQIYDSIGNIIENKEANYLEIKDIPNNLINAFIATEDKRFYNHNGIDVKRIFGALKNNITSSNKQGASTITQQLVKNSYLSPDKSMSRKIKEIRMALTLEHKLTKDEILEKYLNMLYFGSGEYGIKNASYRFFEKDVNELSLKECAILAGIIKSPTKYNPINNYDNSIARANLVLDLMYKNKLISKEGLDSSKKELPIIKNALIYNNVAQKYSENVYFEASKLLNIPLDEIPYMNINIYTYMDNNAQTILHNIISNEDYYSNADKNGIGIILDNTTSGVIAYDSNLSLNIKEFYRSPGSTIKPFAVYGPAFDEKLIQLYTKYNNTDNNFNGYTPNNYNNYISKEETVLDSIIHSYNIPAVSILNDIGVDISANYLKKFNIKLDKNDYNLPLALGGMTYGLSPIKISEMYMTLANNGIYNEATFIKKITTSLSDNSTTSLFEKTSINTRVFTQESTNKLTYALCQTSKVGTSSKLKDFNYDIASKTGTVSSIDKNYNTDIYNVSYTSENTILMWQGGLNKNELLPKNSTGGGQTTIMSRDFLKQYYLSAPKNFDIYNNLNEIFLDKVDYDLGIYTLADNLAPNYNKIHSYIGKNDLYPKQNNSYSNIDNIEIEHENNQILIKLDPRISYDIYKKTLFNLELITSIKDKDGYYILENIDSIFTKYYILPYYFDDENNKILGVPYKYGHTNIEALN